MTLEEIMNGVERPDILETHLELEPYWIELRITDIDTLIELIDGKPSNYTAGGIRVRIICM